MANYANIKATIDANIKANGNEEITGPVLNTVLNAMVTTLGAGYQYAGVAIPSANPGSPDNRVFYIAATAGTYTNMGGLVVADGEVAFLKWDSAWSKEVAGVATSAQVSQLEAKVNTNFVDKTTDMGEPVNSSYSTAEQRYVSSPIRLLYNEPLKQEIPSGVSKIKIKVGSGFGWAAQVWSKTFDSITIPIAAANEYRLFNSSEWTYGEGILELPNGAKSFAITVRRQDNTTIPTDTNVSLEVNYGTLLQYEIDDLDGIISALSMQQESTEETLDDVLIPKSYDYTDITAEIGIRSNAAYSSTNNNYYSLVTRLATLVPLSGIFDLERVKKIRIKTKSGFGWAAQVWSKTFDDLTLPISTPPEYLLFNSSAWTYGEGILDLPEGAKSFAIVIRNTGGTRILTDADAIDKIELGTVSEYKPIQEIVNEINAKIDDEEVILFADKSYVGAKIDMSEREYNRDIYMTLDYSDYSHIATSDTQQAIATYGNYMVRTFKNGGIALYDLETKTFIFDIVLPLDASILSDFHGSNVSFGVEFPTGNTDLPALYVCETTGERRCFVFDLRLDGTCTLLQTLKFTGTWGNGTTDWRDFIVDRQNGVGWWIGYNKYVSGSGADYTIYKKVPLKTISSGDYSYVDADVLDSFTNSNVKVIQGAFILNNHIFIGDYRIYITNIDLISHEEVGYVNLYGFCLEIEGICNYQGKMLADLVHTRGESSTPLYVLNFTK